MTIIYTQTTFIISKQNPQIKIMKGLYEGGQCNPNGIGATSNQYKRMMNSMAVGGQNPEKVMQYIQQGQNFQNQILQRQAMFKQMNQAWGTSQNQVQMMQKQMEMMMSNNYQKEKIQYQMEMARIQESNWIQAQKQMHERNQVMNSQFQYARMMQQANRWRSQHIMSKQYQQANITNQDQQKSIQNSTQQMLDVMLNDTDPRFQNSQFLKFLTRIKKKQVIIEGKQIKEVSPNEVMMEKSWGQGQKMYQKEQMTMKQRIEAAERFRAQQSIRNNLTLQEHWQKKLQDYEKQYKDTDSFEKMLQEKYMQVLKQMNLDLTESWKSATDLEQQLVHGDIRDTYVYDKNNPYLQEKNKKALALQFINKGLNNQAILTLQAYTQQQPEDSEGWRILGRILQQNDQDQKSITCFLNSIKHNPQNLDCMLSLGISCTNVLDEVKAMNFLKKWIILNPKYKHLNIDPNIIPDHQTDYHTYSLQDIKLINNKMISIFQSALVGSKNDSELFNSLAILFFIKRDYDQAIGLFKRALELDPTNYLLMNKVGATLAHLGRSQEAKTFYHMALGIRPNYVRVWVNLGIAHGYQGDYQQAARPDAKHIWAYLHTTLMNLQRYDLISLISKQNPKLFTQFDTIAVSDLPEPQIDYKITTEKHILNKDSTEWLQEFKGGVHVHNKDK